jgi:hypothetical protein
MTAGVLGEFRDPEALLAAVRALRADGYREIDAYTPFPMEELEAAIGLRRSWIGWLVFPVALFGAGFGYWLQWLLVARLYRLDVGGRPPFTAWPFVIIAFETMVLFTGVSLFLLFFWSCRLPRLRHPLFAVDGFHSVSVDGFWLGVAAGDRHFDPDGTEVTLRQLGAVRVEYAGARV